LTIFPALSNNLVADIFSTENYGINDQQTFIEGIVLSIIAVNASIEKNTLHRLESRALGTARLYDSITNGISVETAGNSSIVENSISGIIFDKYILLYSSNENADIVGRGIYVKNSENSLIEGNNITEYGLKDPSVGNFVMSGIELENSGDSELISNIIGSGFSTRFYGIRVKTSDDTVHENNVVYGYLTAPGSRNQGFTWYPIPDISYEMYFDTSYNATILFESHILRNIAFGDTVYNSYNTILYKDGVEITSGVFTNYVYDPLRIDTESLLVGSFSYLIDIPSALIHSNIYVEVVADQSAPFVSQLPDMTVEVGTGLPKFLTWIGKDSQPNTYKIFRGGVEAASGVWANNVPIPYDFTLLTVSTYDFRIELTDQSGRMTSSSTMVTIVPDTTAPVVHRQPGDNLYPSQGGIAHLWWNVSDYNPSSYTIYLNNTSVNTSTWVSYQSIEYFVNTSLAVDYNVTIVIFDSAGQSFRHEVTVEISPDTTPPSVTGTNVNFDEGAVATIKYSVYDSNPKNYTLLLNGSKYLAGPLNSSSTVEFNITGFDVGSYNFTLIAEDINGNKGQDYLILRILADSTAPGLIYSPSITVTEGETGNLFWQIWDDNPDSWKIYLDGVEDKTGTWSGTEVVTITYDLSSLTQGYYVITFEAVDKRGNLVSQDTNVIVNPPSASGDITPPYFDATPSVTYSMREGETGHVLEWTAVDENPGTYKIFVDGNEEFSDSWGSGTPIGWGLDGIRDSVGTHTVLIEFYDQAGNVVSHSVDVTVEPIDAGPGDDGDDSAGGFLFAPIQAFLLGLIGVTLLSVYRRRKY
jgi:tetrahydromethanopterin S-methyltransferase subunit B